MSRGIPDPSSLGLSLPFPTVTPWESSFPLAPLGFPALDQPVSMVK